MKVTEGGISLPHLKHPFFSCKGKAVPLQPWSGPEASRKLRFPDFQDNGTGWW